MSVIVSFIFYYYCCAGTLPWDTVGTCRLYEDLSSQGASIPDTLRTVIKKGLQRHPVHRDIGLQEIQEAAQRLKVDIINLI